MFPLRELVSTVRREKSAAPRLQRLLSVKSNCGTTRCFLLRLQAAYLCLPTTDCYLPVTPLPQTMTHLSTTCLSISRSGVYDESGKVVYIPLTSAPKSKEIQVDGKKGKLLLSHFTTMPVGEAAGEKFFKITVIYKVISATGRLYHAHEGGICSVISESSTSKHNICDHDFNICVHGFICARSFCARKQRQTHSRAYGRVRDTRSATMGKSREKRE